MFVTRMLTKRERKLIKKDYHFEEKRVIIQSEFFFFHFHMIKDKAVSVCDYITDGF